MDVFTSVKGATTLIGTVKSKKWIYSQPHTVNTTGAIDGLVFKPQGYAYAYIYLSAPCAYMTQYELNLLHCTRTQISNQYII